MPKGSKNLQKNDTKKELKKGCSKSRFPGKPGGDPGPVRGKKDTDREHIQRDKPRPFITPRAPSGPERIYWAQAAPGVAGPPPDNTLQSLFSSFQRPFSIFQWQFSRFRRPFSKFQCPLFGLRARRCPPVPILEHFRHLIGINFQ